MHRGHHYLMAGIAVISVLLLHLSIWGLWLTGNQLYLLSLVCCLYTLLFASYHMIKHSRQTNVTHHEICVIFLEKLETIPDPLYAKVMNRS